jgi:hypothetical protein
MKEKEFTSIQKHLTLQLEAIENGTAQFCTLEELDLSLIEIIESYEKKNLEHHKSNPKS